MNSLITGINGFVGRHLAEHLQGCGDKVWGTCIGSSPDSANVTRWDVSQPAAPSLIDQLGDFSPDVIYHLAAISHPGSCGDDLPTEKCQAVNILGTRHVAELALALPTRPKVVFVSSSKVYGERTPESPLAGEDDPPQPKGGYAYSKWAAENILRDRVREGLSVIIVRAFNHTGPGQNPLYLVPEWCEKIASGVSPQTVRSLTTSLDLSDVRDVVRIYRQLVEQGTWGETYNVGSGQGVTTAEVWDMLCEASGHRVEVTAERAGPAQQPIADMAKLHAALGPLQLTPLKQTLADVYRDIAS